MIDDIYMCVRSECEWIEDSSLCKALSEMAAQGKFLIRIGQQEEQRIIKLSSLTRDELELSSNFRTGSICVRILLSVCLLAAAVAADFAEYHSFFWQPGENRADF